MFLIDPKVDPIKVIGFHRLTFITVTQDQLPSDKLLTDLQFKVFEVAGRILIRALVHKARTQSLARWYESHEITRFPHSLRPVKHIDEIKELFI